MLLKQRRLERGLTQEDLAIAGNTQVNISNIENGKQWASKATRDKIEAMIGPVDWVGTRMQSVEWDRSSEADDNTGAILLAISGYVFDSNKVPPVEKVHFLQRALNALEKTVYANEAVLT